MSWLAAAAVEVWRSLRAAGLVGALALAVLSGSWMRAAGEPASVVITPEQWNALLEQNQRLWATVEQQQRELTELRDRLDALASTSPTAPNPSATAIAATAPAAIFTAEATAVVDEKEEREMPQPKLFDRGDRPGLRISGEAGLAWFSGESDNAYPNSEFRVDSAKLFVEAQAARNVFLFSELDLTTREANDEFFHLGETYLEFEGLSWPWSDDATFTLRAGRIDIPFGEEYLRRDVMANPLVTHSLPDIWGVDEGVEIFGDAGGFDYVVAVQNGSHRTMRDFNSDKSVTARLGFSPARGWRTSVSAMRTGKVDRANDSLTEVWFGNGFFRALGPAATTRTFTARLAQLDAVRRWREGHLLGAVGRAWFDDDDAIQDNRRRINFWHVEGMQRLTTRLYGAMRYSRIDTDRGYPLVGLSGFGKYFFNSAPTKKLWRLGVGLGYRVHSDVLLKLEYTFEEGELIDGISRNNADQFAAEAGVRF